jgi:hypothetical protein
MKKPILTLADDQVNVVAGQILIYKLTNQWVRATDSFKNDKICEVYDVDYVEEIPEAEKMKSVVSDEEILSKANDFYKKPRPGYIDIELSGSNQ